MDESNRADLSGLKPNGKYARIVGVYRHNTSAGRIGVFVKGIIEVLASKVKWIAHNGAGYDQIDVLECKAKGSCARPHHIFTRILISLSSTMNQGIQHPRGSRRRDRYNGSLPSNLYPSPILPRQAVSLQIPGNRPSTQEIHYLTSRTLGILGLGGIGSRLSYLAHAFPMRIVCYPYINWDAWEWGKYYDKLDDMLRVADVLSVHIPLNKENEGFVGEKEVRLLKKGGCYY